MRRARGPAGRLAAWLSEREGLIALFAVGLLVRLLLLGGDGHVFDMALFRSWTERMTERGPSGFYPEAGEDFFVDYPPGYLYVLWGIGHLARAVGYEVIPAFLFKLPAIAADLALAVVAMLGARRLFPRNPGARGLGAAAVLMNPAVIFVSSVWGQVDALAAVFVLASVVMLGTGRASLAREAGGMALLAAAVGTKPQAAFVLPVVVLVLGYRHLRRGLPRGAARMVVLGAIGAAAGMALLAPFRLDPFEAFRFYADAAGTYELTSLFAFNLWGAFGFWRADVGNDALRFLGVPAFAWGLALFSLAGSMVLARAWRSLSDGRHEGRVLLFGGVSLSLVGFVFLTRIHERYLFVPVALCAALVGGRLLGRLFVGLSALYLFNLVYAYAHHIESAGRPAPWYAPVVDFVYGPASGDLRQRILSAVTAAGCLVIAWWGWHGLGGPVESSDPVEDVERQDAPQVH